MLVGLGVGGVADEDFPPPVQGAACLMVGYEASPAPGTAGSDLASAAIQHVRDRLALLESGMTDHKVTELLESMVHPEKLPELPQGRTCLPLRGISRRDCHCARECDGPERLL